MSAAAEAAVSGPPWRILASPRFRVFWGAHLLTFVGESFTVVALPWLVLQLTGSGLAVGLVATLQAVPRAALMIVGGAFADRISPSAAMRGSALVRAALIGLLAVLILLHLAQLWEVAGVALLAGTVSAFYMPARGAILPGIVAADRLETGNALLNLNQTTGMVVGPALAGLLVAGAGTGPAFAVDALGFGLAAVLLMLLPRPETGATGGRGPTLVGDIRAGLAYVWRDVGIRAALILTAAVNVGFAAAIEVGLPVLVHQRYQLGAAAFGSLLAAWGLGAVAGVVAAGLVPMPRRFGLLIIGIVAWCGAVIGCLGLAPPLPVALALQAALGVATGVVNTYGIAWLQRRAEPAMQGRLMGITMLASVGLAPISLAVAGLLAQQHVVLLFAAGAAVILAAAAGSAVSRTVREMTA